MGIGNDLFNYCISIYRLVCLSKSAFKNYNELLQKSLDNANNFGIDMALVVLRSTASISI